MYKYKYKCFFKIELLFIPMKKIFLECADAKNIMRNKNISPDGMKNMTCINIDIVYKNGTSNTSTRFNFMACLFVYELRDFWFKWYMKRFYPSTCQI